MELKLAVKQPKILAIDPATNCGWAISTQLYGTWNLAKKSDSWGMRLVRLRAKLKEICDAEKPTILVYERPMGRFAASTSTGYRIVGVLESFCVDNNIEISAYSPGEVKKFATGKGSANKQKMIEYARIKYGYAGKSDDEADALHLLHLAKKDLLNVS